MTETLITPSEHSDVVGGSTADRVLHCPGSVNLNRAVKQAHLERILHKLIEDNGLSPNLEIGKLPENVLAAVNEIYEEETTSSYAAEGTGLHEAMAWLLENDEEPESVVDRTFAGILITPTLYSEAVIPALNAFDDFCDEVYAEDGEELEFVVEKRCQVPGIPDAWGTSDIIGKTSKRVVVWDWKFGAGKKVSAEDNSQLKFYARGAIFTLAEWLGFQAVEPADDLRIDLIICQPRIGDGALDMWQTDYAELEAFRWALVAAVAEAVGDNPKVKRGDHCLWCNAKHICPAKQQLGQRILDRVDQAYEDTDAEDTEDIIDVLRAQEVQFTPQDLADWVQDAKDIQDWCKFILALAYEELNAGRKVTGWELDQGLGNAAWTVDDKTVERRLASYGLDVHARRNVSPISPTKARTAVKKLGNEKHMKLLEKIIDRPTGGLKMVPKGTAKNPKTPLSDKAKAIGKKLKGA